MFKLTFWTLVICVIVFVICWWDNRPQRKLDRIVARKLDEQFGRE